METLKAHPLEEIILTIRGQKVIIDRDLAQLYGVPTKQLNRQVLRNLDRFPVEFMFRLSKKEKDELAPNWHRFDSLKHSTTPPYAFTEHGVAMVANVLRSKKASRISIYIIKTFIRLRTMVFQQVEFSKKLGLLESKLDKHDNELQMIIQTLRDMMAIPEKPKRQIGFHVKDRLQDHNSRIRGHVPNS